jgi:hypothetical protein
MLKKNTLTNRLTTGGLSLMFLVGLLYGCQTPVYVAEAPSELVNFKKILILPFKDVTTLSGDTMDSRCPVCGRVFVTGEVAAGAADFLSDQSIAWLKGHTDYQLVTERLTARSLATLYSANQATGAAIKALIDKGRAHDADVVLVGFVYRFRERIGKGYGAESPASVAFGMHLIRVTDGGTIWSAHYDETQKSLGDDLFQLGTFISRGGRWLTAEELAMSGLEKIFKKFPKS